MKPCLVVLLLGVLVCQLHAQLIGNAKLEKCLRQSSDASSKLMCDEKMVMTLSISHGKQLEVHLLDSVSVAGSPEKQKIDGEFKVTVHQSTQPSYEYPLVSQNLKVNYCPRETQKIIKDFPLLSLCKADADDENPTCGWSLDEQSRPIPFSQGFCCKCNGLLPGDSSARAGSSCGLFDFSSSAHCMRYSPIWYSVSSIEPPILNTDIKIDISYNNKDTSLHLSPSQPLTILRKEVHKTPFSLSAELIGQLQASQLPPSFESNYLLSPVTSPLAENMQQYMAIVPKNMVTITGDECDKIGVSHSSFYTQSERCAAAPSTCLRNQLCDLQLIDSQRLKTNQKPFYFVGLHQNLDVTHAKDSDNEILVYPLTEGIQNSLISLEVDAASIRLVSNVSPGELVDVVVHPFESQSASGQMEVQVKNIGSLQTTKTITVACSSNIALVNPVQFRINPQETLTKVIRLFTTDSDAQTHTCTVKLFSEQNQIEDTATVKFDTTDTVLVTPEKKSEEQNPEVTKEEEQGSFDGFDFGTGFADFFNSALQSPLLIGALILVVLLILGIITMVVVVVCCYCAISTNSLPLLFSICCQFTRMTNSSMKAVGAQNRKLAKKMSKNSSKSRSRRKKHASSKRRKYSSEEDSSTDSSSSDESHHRARRKTVKTPKRKTKKRRVQKSRRRQRNASPARQVRTPKRKRTKDDSSKYDEHTTGRGKSHRAVESGRRKLEATPSAAKPKESFVKEAPQFTTHVEKQLLQTLKQWEQERRLVYCSVSLESIDYEKSFRNLLNVGRASNRAVFGLAGFLRFEGEDRIHLDFCGEGVGSGGRFQQQWFEFEGGKLERLKAARKLTLSSVLLSRNMAQYQVHCKYVKGPVLNLCYSEGNQAIWAHAKKNASI